MKEKYKPEFQIIGYMTLVTSNIKEIPDFMKNYKSLGFDKIEFGYDFRVPYYLKFNANLKKKISKEIMLMSNSIRKPKGIDFQRLQQLGLIV